MSSWPPPVVPADASTPASTAPRDGERGDAGARRDAWAAVGSAFALASVVTVIAVIVGSMVLEATLPPDRGDSDSGNGLAYLAWTFAITMFVGPVTAWMVVTNRWRRLAVPSSGARIVFAAALLFVPSFILAAILGWFIGDRVNRDVQGVALPIAFGCSLIGVLVTGRMLRARYALAGLGLIVTGGVAVCTIGVMTADARSETRIRDAVQDTSIPLALPAAHSGWTVTTWSVRDQWGPTDEIGAPTRRVASIGLVDLSGNELSLKMWEASADWYCRDVRCDGPVMAIDEIGVLRYQAGAGWVHDLLPRGDQLWVVAYPRSNHDDDIIVRSVLSALEPVTPAQWAAAVRPLPGEIRRP